jgi:predicted esterase
MQAARSGWFGRWKKRVSRIRMKSPGSPIPIGKRIAGKVRPTKTGCVLRKNCASDIAVRLFAVLFCAVCLPAQNAPQVLTVFSAADQSQQPYAVSAPRSFEAGKTYPLIISLHSEDSDHRLNLVQLQAAAARGWIIACPQARGAMGYQGIAEQDVYDVLDDVMRRFPVDENRIFLTGISMGGGGALWLGMTRPTVWAGIAALCPDVVPGLDELAGNLLNVPVRLFHGESDPVVPVAQSRIWQRRLLDAGVPVAYFEYPSARHNVWDVAYRGAVEDWFDSLHRAADPERVQFRTRSYEHRTAYWVRIDGLTPGTMASIDARRIGKTDLRVETRNVDGFTITVETANSVTIDGTPLRVKAPASLSFTKSAAGWRAGLYQPTGKRPGAEGPMVAAVSARHLYVYGSLGTQTADELDARKKVAESAAAWSTSRSRLSLKLAVKRDTEVTAQDLETCNLVLFGTAWSNSVVARIQKSLPIELRPDAADYGLLFIAPVGKHYALINSGLNWWTGADEAAVSGYALAPWQFRRLAALGDFLLFRGSPDHVVAEGRFDQNWKVPADAAARMKATGTVTIH